MNKDLDAFFIRPPKDSDKEAWLAMWPDYADFEPPSQDRLDRTWALLMDENRPPYGLFLYEKDTDKMAGFIHYVLHITTWSEESDCYLEDAYILPEHRGKRAFNLLYQELKKLMPQKNWRKIYWITRETNTTAQNAYDRIAKKTDWIRYEDKRKDTKL